MNASLLDAIYLFCTTDPTMVRLGGILNAAGLPGALFFVGLAGGVTHCTGMCGPFVLAQITGDTSRMAAPRLSEWQRLKGAALLPYHIGRLTTYTGLGGVAGAAGGLVATLAGARWLSSLFLALAALLFICQGVVGIGHLVRNPLGDALAGPLARLTRPLLGDPRGWRGYLLGLALGFLPCGFLYGALAAAAGSGSAAGGALAMAAFTLGTVPNLVLVGYLGVFFGRSAGRWAQAFAAPLMLANAAVLALLAVRALS
jgi:sulfite exporter TauE/SafE